MTVSAKLRPIRTTLTQRRALEGIRIFVAEQGYRIFPVATWYRRHKLDFIAVPTNGSQQLLLIRPARTGVVEIRPYAYRVLYRNLRAKLVAHRKEFGRMHWRRQLPMLKKRGGWKSLISRNCRVELDLFTNS